MEMEILKYLKIHYFAQFNFFLKTFKAVVMQYKHMFILFKKILGNTLQQGS